MNDYLSQFYKKKYQFFSIEMVFILPVIIFISMMFFELIRIFLVITIVGNSLKETIQEFNYNEKIHTMPDEILEHLVGDGIIIKSHSIVSLENIFVDIQNFSELNIIYNGKIKDDRYLMPIINVSVLLDDKFITPLPAFFGLGYSFQYEYREMLGGVIGDDGL